ncbi:MAG: alpha-amylase family glycosyl hydrolase [Gemmatimonadaceae bacterium]
MKVLWSRTPRAVFNAAVLLVTLSSSSLKSQQPNDVSKEQAHPIPTWARDGVIYELNTRNFSATGDFKGVTARLGELQKLGVTIIWLMPIHPIGQQMKKGTIGSPYAVRDYYGINPDFGTKDDLTRLISEAHKLGMKVIIDVVVNHTSWDSKLMSTPSYYKRDAAGKVLSPYDWTDVAALDYENPALRKYITDNLVWWVKDVGLDGFRCDVAWNIPRSFWDDTRAKLEAVKSDVFMLAEAHTPELLVKAFDADYAWPLYHATASVIQEGRSATMIREEWEKERDTYPRGATHMRISDDHDEKRAIARFGERGALAASALVFLMDGIPLLYNGMEVGDVTESTDPALFEKMPVFWSIGRRRPEFAKFYAGIIPLRREHAVLRTGELRWIGNSDDARVVTFVRRDASEELLVAINFSNRPFAGTVEASGNFTEITPGGDAMRSVGLPALSLDAWGYRVFKRSR